MNARPESTLLQRPSRGAARRLARALALDDFETLAHGYLPRPIFGYIAGASETSASARDNRAAFADYALLPRTLVDAPRATALSTAAAAAAPDRNSASACCGS